MRDPPEPTGEVLTGQQWSNQRPIESIMAIAKSQAATKKVSRSQWIAKHEDLVTKQCVRDEALPMQDEAVREQDEAVRKYQLVIQKLC